MRVTALNVELEPGPKFQFAMPGQVFLTAGKTYDVSAMTFFEGHSLILIVDDLGRPTWLPTWLFQIVDTPLPTDWMVNLFESEPRVVLGPSFIAGSLESYTRMVEGDPAAETTFWQRVRAGIRPSNDD